MRRMQLRLNIILGLVIFSIATQPADAKIDPLKRIKDARLRADILIVLDVSGSMRWDPAHDWTEAGANCTGDRSGQGLDICGDGLCEGGESKANCLLDCNLQDRSDCDPLGMGWTADGEDYCLVLPLDDTQPGSSAKCDQQDSPMSRMMIVKRALRAVLPDLRTAGRYGLISFDQRFFDGTTGSFGGGNYQYHKAIPGAAKLVTVFFTEWELKQMRQSPGLLNPVNAWDTVNDRPMNAFMREGYEFNLLSDTGLVDTAGNPIQQDSLYRRSDNVTEEMRMAWDWAGYASEAGGHTFDYIGSYYTYKQLPSKPPHTDWNGSDGVVRREPLYRGPQFQDGAETFVYRRYDGVSGNAQFAEFVFGAWNAEGVSEAINYVPLNNTGDDDQAEHDRSLGQIMQLLNYSDNGGLLAVGLTPLTASVKLAGSAFATRAATDADSACRPRYVVLLTDGQDDPPEGVLDSVTALYFQDSSNPIKLIPIGVPGLAAGAEAQLHKMADIGDDGDGGNGSAKALLTNTEADLISTLRKALFNTVKADYVSDAPGAATLPNTTSALNMSLIASTEFPGWQGRLRAFDLTNNPPTEAWEFSAKLAAKDWKTRKIYTGFHNSRGSGAPVPLLADDGSGTINLNGGCSGCGPDGLTAVWAAATGGDPVPAEFEGFLQELVGKSGNRLGALMRMVPATVDGYPNYGTTQDHQAFKPTRAALTYIASNSGLIHAIAPTSGEEIFAYVPPQLLKKAYNLYKNGGQDEDPDNFVFLMANSPRVEDMVHRGGEWRTQLVQTLGPGGDDFVVLDISAPYSCLGEACTISTPPIYVLAATSAPANPVVTGPADSLGQTYALPALFWDKVAGAAIGGRAAMASGYVPGGFMNPAGTFYNYVDTATGGTANDPAFPYWIIDGPGQHQIPDLDSDGAAVTADTVAMTEEVSISGPRIIASYQADPRGRIWRFKLANPNDAVDNLEVNGLGLSWDYPFYYAPAVQRQEGNVAIIAAASGSFEDTMGISPIASKIYLFAEEAGTIDAGTYPNFSCGLDLLCEPGACGAGHTVWDTDKCLAGRPSLAGLPARPSSRPLLLSNSLNAMKTEAFYLFYQPPSQKCQGNKIAIGDSYVIRMSISANSANVMHAQKIPQTQASGLTLVGGGTNIAMSISATVDKKLADTKLVSAGALPGSAAVQPLTESWLEVR